MSSNNLARSSEGSRARSSDITPALGKRFYLRQEHPADRTGARQLVGGVLIETLVGSGPALLNKSHKDFLGLVVPANIGHHFGQNLFTPSHEPSPSRLQRFARTRAPIAWHRIAGRCGAWESRVARIAH